MAVRLQQVPVVSLLECKPGREVRLRLDRTSMFRRYMGKFHFRLRTGSAAFSANASNVKSEGTYNLLKGLRLATGSGNNKFRYSGTDKKYIHLFEHGIKPIADPLVDIPANSSRDFTTYLPFDFATRPRVLSDFSALYNARANQQNDFYVDWGTINDLFADGNAPDGMEIDADGTYVEFDTLRAFEDGRDPVQIEDVAGNLLDYREGVEEYDIEKANVSFDDSIQRIPINPPKSIIANHLIFGKENITDGNPRFSNDVVKQLKILNVLGGGETIVQADWDQIWAANRHDLRLSPTHPKGIIYLDWPDQRQGAGIVNENADDLEMRILTSAPATGKHNAIRNWYRYLPTV